jgi:hypothetical protein
MSYQRIVTDCLSAPPETFTGVAAFEMSPPSIVIPSSAVPPVALHE